MRKLIIVVLSLLLTPFIAFAAQEAKSVDDPINKIISDHYAKYHDMEYFSGIALSIYSPGQGIKDYYFGQISRDKNAKKMDADTLFEIGSITKSFTSAIILQMEKEKALSLDDKLDHWLPEYSKWSSASLKTMLNMTSNLPNYSDAPLVEADMFNKPDRQWTEKELIQAVYPSGDLNPPLRSGYYYSNTGYILASMIIEKISHDSFQNVLQNRLIKPLQLNNTFYPLPSLDGKTYDRLAQGYGYNPYGNPELVGKEMKNSSLTWAGAAGAIISTPHDVTSWVKALFIDDQILDEQQKQKIKDLVSTDTGLPIKKTSAKTPHGFGLGVSEGFDPDIGRYWYYEGETEGFRALYMYDLNDSLIISCVFNSAVDGQNDHAGELMKAVYKVIKSLK